MSGLWLPLGALIISVFLVFMFFSKENIKNSETKIYSYMLILNLIYAVLGAFGYWFSMVSGNLHIMALIQKVYLVILLLLAHGIFLYYISIAGLSTKVYNAIYKLSIIFSVGMSIMILVTKVTTIIDKAGQSLDVAGLSYYNAMVGVIIYFVGIIIAAIISSLNGKVGIQKKIPLLVFVPLFAGGLLLRKYYPEVITETFFFAFFYLVMYFTIENPDMKMVNKLTIARDEADKANRAKTDFLSSMSHEIRTPLNTLVGLSNDILSYKDKVPHQVQEDANDIVNASNSLLEVVGNILDISKIESDKLELTEKPYNFVKVVEELCKLDATRIEDKSIDFKVDISDDIPYQLIGDEVHVKQIINNLVTNAIKYTDSGEINVIVTCEDDIETGICNLKIVVKDTGIGIKKEHLEKIFDKFERLDIDKNSTVGGTGLGLAITKELVNMMNGTIEVSSVVDKGSTFTVNIPQKIDKMGAPVELYPDTEVKENDFSHKKVLVVDDNKLNVKVAKRVLSSLNMDVDEAFSGRECVDKIKSGMKYDLILMDIMMPNMSGETTLMELKRKQGFSTPVIAVTADAISGAREKYLDKGFFDYIAKPFNKEQIEEKLNKVFGINKDTTGNTPFSPFEEDRFKGVDGVVVGEDKE